MKNHEQSSGVPKHSFVTITPAKIRNIGRGALYTGMLFTLLSGAVSSASRGYHAAPEKKDIKVTGRIVKVEPTFERGSKIPSYFRMYVSTNNGNTTYYAGTLDSAQGWYERCHVGQEVVLEGLAEQGTGVFPMEGVHNLANVCR